MAIEAAKFIVVAPPYAASGGVRVLHKLSGTLARLGYWARLVILDNAGPRAAEVGDLGKESALALLEADEAAISEAIVIYPEIVTSNILGARRVVWYLLNRDGALGRGKISAGPDDYFLSHSTGFSDPRTNRILHCADFNAAFYPSDPLIPQAARHLTLTYIGKGGLYGPCFLAPGSVAISNEWPRCPEELARLLQVTRYFFTWDAWSALNTEAVLCGAMPVIMRWAPWTSADLQRDETGGLVPFLDYGEHVLGGEWKMLLFSKQRMSLIRGITDLDASWNARVKVFAEDAIAHW
jgi:hypothetical protein